MDNKYKVGVETIAYLIESLLHISEFLEDKDVTEIQINDDNKIFVEKAGVGKVFTGLYAPPEHTLNLIQTLGSMENKEINMFSPNISTILPYKNQKCRFEGTIPPVTVNPTCTIRKKSIKIIPLESYVESGFLTPELKELILYYLKSNKNILVVGGTNTGKTTFLNALVNTDVVLKDRLLIVEEVREIQCKAQNKNSFELFPWFDGKAALKTAVRYTPERIIFGEVRGAEAFDMLNVFNTGHGGGVTTIHANDCLSALDKLETFVLYTQPHTMSKLISRVIQVVIDLGIHGTTRYLKSIAEVKGYENNKYILDFKYKSNLDKEEKIEDVEPTREDYLTNELQTKKKEIKELKLLLSLANEKILNLQKD